MFSFSAVEKSSWFLVIYLSQFFISRFNSESVARFSSIYAQISCIMVLSAWKTLFLLFRCNNIIFDFRIIKKHIIRHLLNLIFLLSFMYQREKWHPQRSGPGLCIRIYIRLPKPQQLRGAAWRSLLDPPHLCDYSCKKHYC